MRKQTNKKDRILLAKLSGDNESKLGQSAESTDEPLSVSQSKDLDLPSMHLALQSVYQFLNSLQSKCTEISSELDHVRSATKCSGQRLITQIENVKNDIQGIQIEQTRQSRLSAETRSDVDAQHETDLSIQRKLNNVESELNVALADLDVLKTESVQLKREVEVIRKRHFSVLTISVASVVSLLILMLAFVSLNRLSKVADNDRLRTVEQYVIQHHEILQGTTP